MRLYLSRSMFLTVQKLDFQFLVSGMISRTILHLVFAAALRLLMCGHTTAA
jgi:hypothetical protein